MTEGQRTEVEKLRKQVGSLKKKVKRLEDARDDLLRRLMTANSIIESSQSIVDGLVEAIYPVGKLLVEKFERENPMGWGR